MDNGQQDKTRLKDTMLLQSELINAKSPEQFVRDNQESLGLESVAQYLNSMLIKYNLEKCDIAKRGGFTGNYTYQIFNGNKSASRDKLIQIAVGFPLSVEETQRLLRLGGYSELYVKNSRDAFLMFAIGKRYDIQKINELLYENNYALLE